jgi:hypothetical protein
LLDLAAIRVYNNSVLPKINLTGRSVVKRAIAALLLWASLAPPALPQTVLRVYGPVDLGLDTARAAPWIDNAPYSGTWMLLARNRNDVAPAARDGLIGLTVPLGKGSFSAGYVHNPDLFQSDARATKVAFGYHHLLSKDTTFYVVGSRLRNGVTVRYQTPLPGRPRQLISVGIRHQF